MSLPEWIQQEKTRQEITAKQEAVVENMTGHVLLGQILKEWWTTSSTTYKYENKRADRRIYPTKYNPVQKYWLMVTTDEQQGIVLNIDVVSM